MRTFARLACASVLLAATPALAAPKTAVTVVAGNASSLGLAAELKKPVRDAAKAHGTVELVDLEAKVDLDGKAARAKAAEKAKADLELGRSAVKGKDYRLAVDALGKAMAGFEQSDLTREIRNWLDARALRAVATLGLGDKKTAFREFSEVFSIAPTYALEAGVVDKKMEPVVKEAQKQGRKLKKTTLELRVAPVPAMAWVDGFSQGITPLTVADLAPIEHWVTLAAPGFVPQNVKLKAGAPAPILELTPAKEAADWLAAEKELGKSVPAGTGAAAASKLAAWAGAEQAVIVHVLTKDGVTTAAALKVDAAGKVLAEKSATLPQGKGAIDAAKGLVKELLDVLPPKPEPEKIKVAMGGVPIAKVEPPIVAPPPVPEPAVEKTIERDEGGISQGTVGLIVGGVGVLGLGGGVIFGLQANGAADDAKAVPQIDTAGYDDKVASAESAALLADVCFGVGAVGLGVGAFLFFTDDGDASGAKVSVVPTSDGAVAAFTGSF